MIREGLWVELRERLNALWLPLRRGFIPTGLGIKLSVCPSCLQAQQGKFLSDVENELEELAVTIAQAKKMVELIKVTLERLCSVSAALLGWGWRRRGCEILGWRRGCEILGCMGCRDGAHRCTMKQW